MPTKPAKRPKRAIKVSKATKASSKTAKHPKQAAKLAKQVAAPRPVRKRPELLTDGLARCDWSCSDVLLRDYHDSEWGVPIHDDRHWFEKLILDGAQAGLSWLTILRKRDAYREALHDFDAARVARFTERDLERLMQNPGIVRNRLKVESTAKNARAFLAIQAEHGSFDKYIWSFTDGEIIQNRHQKQSDIPARSPLSDAVSKDLKRRGFTFVGSTIVYAFLQASGVVNDHLVTCHRYPTLAARKR
jgi:DNA-3-methyladenine glycosylase I